jgi:polysaccharide export outer membrane protein
MKHTHFLLLLLLLLSALGAVAAPAPAATAPPVPPPTLTDIKSYRLSPNDVVLVKVYQEDDLETKMRIGADGTATFPLIGSIKMGGLTVEQATQRLRDLLDKDFLVNPQVTVSVMEYSKHRFTVLGQVQKPGTYEIPSEETVTLLEAIAMAGGYTRLANPSRVVVSRSTGPQRTTLSIDARALGNNPAFKPFEILPDDTITVAERVF